MNNYASLSETLFIDKDNQTIYSIVHDIKQHILKEYNKPQIESSYLI